jgi:signal transduction histidine kinase
MKSLIDIKSQILRRLRRLKRALYLDRISGQIALVILALIISFQVIWIASHSRSYGTSSIFETDEMLATAFVALNVTPTIERWDTLAALKQSFPRYSFSISDGLDGLRKVNDSMSRIDKIKDRLWKSAEPFVGQDAENHPFIAVALQKGGYALAQGNGSDAHLLRGRSQSSSFFLRLAERSGFFFIFSASILAFWASHTIVKPLIKISQQAESVSDDSDKNLFIAESGPKEVKELARALNRMRFRIRAMTEARSKALAGVSHDLRTIITRIKLRSELVEDDSLKSKFIMDADLMNSMLTKNLQYLKDGSAHSERALIDLNSILNTLTDQFVDLGFRVECELADKVAISASAVDLSRIFNNLVENAVSFGQVVKIVAARKSEVLVEIDVVDDGPGIDDEHKQDVLIAFVRGEPGRTVGNRSGFGLGLSIVCSLLDEIGGTLQLLDNKPHGLIARVTLPIANHGP